MEHKTDCEIKIGIIGSHCGKPIDILLPIINEEDFKQRTEISENCFYIYSMEYTKVLLFYIDAENRKLARIDIRPACKEHTHISLYVIKKDTNQFFLRAYTDEQFNGIYPLPF